MHPIGLDSSGGRLDALLETMRAFAEAATDYQLLLDTITERVTLLLGEGCSIYLTTDDGEAARPVALVNRSQTRMGVVHGHFGQPLPLEGGGTTARVIREGRTIRVPVVDAHTLASEFRPEDVPTLSRLEVRSLLVVPLQVRKRTVGALAISRHGDNRTPFSAEDELFAETLANHAALALRNAQLLESVQRELDERKKAEAETKKFVALVQRSREFIAMASFDGRVLFVNAAGRELLGVRPDDDLANIPLSAFHTDDGMKRAEVIRAIGHWEGEGQLRHFTTGELIPTQVSSLVLRSLEGEPLCFATVQRDLRETRRLEERLRQAHKMEAIGQLAGGVAHDFNNLLTVILGYSHLLLDAAPEGAASQGEVREIHKAGERAAALTQQLLAFSRQQLLEPRVVDLNQVLRGMSEMMQRLLGEDVVLKLELEEKLGKILVDPSQMEQVVLNLAVNARDAMPSGGALTLTTGNIDLTGQRAKTSGMAAGPYVMLSVRDTGTGMDPDTTNRIFEPFFTTKAKGKGTGLGLATVFGIVEQSRGHIVVTSALGKGTVFDVYVPRTEQSVVSIAPQRANIEPRGNETILLVEDDSQVRGLMSSVLKQAGYQVLEAAEPVAALARAEQAQGAIDLLLTDVVMPGMSGRELARRLSALRVQTKVLYVSGYAEDALGHHGVLDPGIALLRKPVTPVALQRRVREVLDDDAERAPLPPREDERAAERV
jgi:PAS domain S-box-containing protein